ncbi:MAG: hypothetical protein ABIO14_14255 [Aeromicrobium sp.]
MPKSRTLALSRQSLAVSLFAQGCTFDQIAKQVGFANRGTAHRVVTTAFRNRISDDIDMHRDIELNRLEALLSDLWEMMLEGNLAAHREILHVVELECKLLGLFKTSKVVQPRMLVDPALGNT